MSDKTPKRLDEALPEYTLVEKQEMMRGVGYGNVALERIQVGVVNSWGEVNPASTQLDKVTKAVKDGIWAAGGTPREFCISSICTSMAGGDNYHLPHRDIVAAYIETVAMTNMFDAMVFVPVCDDVVPGHLMAAARLDLPAVVVTGGYMQLNKHKGGCLDPFEVPGKHYNNYRTGKTDKQEFDRILDKGCMGGGACPVMATANTMATLTEALGMSLPGTAAVPGTDSRLLRIAFNAGVQAVELHRANIRPSDILTPEAFENANRVLMAVGGSTNGILHLQAIASELDIEMPPETFNLVSKSTPFICDIAPSGAADRNMADLDEVGGVPTVMKSLESLLNTGVTTVTGQTLAKDLEQADMPDGDVVRSLDNPVNTEGGLIFLTGSLAPEGALVKTSAVPKNLLSFTGPTRLFAQEEDACEALHAGELNPGDIVVVRNKGPKGDPGMRISHRFLWMLTGKGMTDQIGFITDGRLSGSNKGCAIAHLSPEAAELGPLAVLQEGDLIEIDIPNGALNLKVATEEMQKRLAEWKPVKNKIRKGYLALYSRLAKSPSRGANLNYEWD